MTQANAWRTCSNCGTRNTATDDFCARCGFSLTSPLNTMQTSISPPSHASSAAQSFANAPTIASGGSPPTGNVAAAPRRITGTLQAQTVVGGRYRILRLVGKGGFGVVYQAQDERFQASRMLAIKEMSDARLSPSDRVNALQAFRREADFLVPLKHANLPDVSDFFEEAGKAYLVMEFIEGQTLEHLLEDAGGPLDEPRVMAWALQLCDVLHYLHTRPQPIIFRDLKPSNVMVTATDQLKLIDFGIARLFKSTSVKDTTSFGSAGFAPLEQYGRGQSDARADIYALGATLYNLLTDIVPPEAPMRLVQPAAFQSPRQLNSRISAATETIVLKAMANEPDKRFQSAQQMYQAIIDSGVASTRPSHTLLAILPAAAPRPQSAPPPTIGAQQSPLAAQPTMVAPSTLSPGSPPTSIPARRLSTAQITRRALLAGLLIAGVGGVAALAANGALAPLLNQGGGSVVAGPALTLDFVYSTEKDRWLTAAIDAFHKSRAAQYQGRSIRINPLVSGSLDLTDRVIKGEIKPVAWSPASSLELNQLNTAWRQQHGGQDIVVNNDIRPLVLSPLVFAVWDDRAKILLNTYGHIDWDSVSTALQLKNGWPDIGGPQDWQVVKLGQTRPDESNSGLLAITLMAYAFFQKTRGLTSANIADPDFQRYFALFEDAVTAYGHSSGTYLEREVILKGPGAYDITFTYENLVLVAQDEIKQRQLEPLRAFYPHVNIESDHPFAFLQGSWLNQDLRSAATIFRDFLLDVPQQQLALRYGLRPTHPNVHLSDHTQGNLFLSASVPASYTAVQAPDGTVVHDLLQQWLNRYHDVPTTNG